MKPAGHLEPQPWMTDGATLAVMTALSADGATPRFVGGCVRDALLDRPVKDIDIATPDTPETVIEKLAAAGLKSVPTGLKHGTITAVADRHPYEVTTLRQDVETDGRHAEVAFTDDWTEDAARRDLTLNTIYCDVDGTLYDPVGGLVDLRTGVIRFVGEADQRIKEDVLRILRFFRFFAHYARGGIDATGLQACQKHAHLLPTLSAERISAEILKLLAADDPATTLEYMVHSGVLAQILPGDCHVDLVKRLAQIEQTLSQVDPLRRLYVLGLPDPIAATALARQYRLSNAQKLRLKAMAKRSDIICPGVADKDLRKMLYQSGALAVLDATFVNQTLAETSVTSWDELRRQIEHWQKPQFPLQGQDVLDLGMLPGPDVGRLVADMENWWIENDFRPDRDACLTRLSGLIARP
jgi:poly(A) polymerase